MSQNKTGEAAGMEVLSANAGAAGTMMHEVLCARMCGHVKADDNDTGVNVGMHESHRAGDRHRRRVVGMWECMGMGKSGSV